MITYRKIAKNLINSYRLRSSLSKTNYFSNRNACAENAMTCVESAMPSKTRLSKVRPCWNSWRFVSLSRSKQLCVKPSCSWKKKKRSSLLSVQWSKKRRIAYKSKLMLSEKWKCRRRGLLSMQIHWRTKNGRKKDWKFIGMTSRGRHTRKHSSSRIFSRPLRIISKSNRR